MELAELNRKLKSFDEELDRLNKRFDETQGESRLYHSGYCLSSLIEISGLLSLSVIYSLLP